MKNKNYPAYKFQMGEYLIRNGHNLIGISENQSRKGRYVMWFKDTPQLQQHVLDYIANSK